MKRISLALITLSLLVGCAPSSLRVVEFKNFSDERLLEYYDQLDADVKKETIALEEASTSGRIVKAGVNKGYLSELKKRRAQVWVELRRRDIQVDDPNPMEP